MRILVTGISGLKRERAWPEVPKDSVFDMGVMMLEIAGQRSMNLNEQNILHAGRDTLAALRAAAIAKINTTTSHDTQEMPSIVSTHSVFARIDGLFEGLHSADLAELKPNVWVTLIDGPQAIEGRLTKHKAEYFHLDVWDIVKWQELEVFYSNHLASDLNIRHYVVPVTQPEVFAAIASGDRRSTAYASYPMSHASASTKEKIVRFVDELKKHYIVFDPSSIESSHDNKKHHTAKDKKAIGSHTIVRDLDWFIRINADAVIAYWPEVIFSSGMSDELRYAYEIGKRTILVTERREEGGLPLLSPFLTYKASIFWSSEELFEFLDLAETDREFYLACQEVMAEEFRAHDSGATKLTRDAFEKECKKLAEYRSFSIIKEDAREGISTIAPLVYKSWETLLSMASRRGQPKHVEDASSQEEARPASERSQPTREST